MKLNKTSPIISPAHLKEHAANHAKCIHLCGAASGLHLQRRKTSVTLLSLVEAFAIDESISSHEVTFYHNWLSTHAQETQQYPLKDLTALASDLLVEGPFNQDIYEDLVWFSDAVVHQFNSCCQHSTDRQRLHVMLGGAAVDGEPSIKTCLGLQAWLIQHPHLTAYSPYEEALAAVAYSIDNPEVGRTALMDFLKPYLSSLGSRLSD